ncbi:GPI ethanolamine phosphate transferase 1 [Trichonephila clavipes]|nr:GPI ethanolamine phosphate transferase 1 [Trichonephila clavipes]
MIPFLIVSCVLRAINVCLKVSPRALFLLILLMSDFLGLHFFFLVKDTGSWLDIGTSLSHFIISITIIIFIMLLYGLAWILTSVSLTVPSLKLKRHIL